MAIEPRTGLEIFGPVIEQSSCEYEAVLVTTDEDEDGVQIPVPSLSSLFLTVYDLDTNALIRPRGSVLNENGGIFDSGTLTMVFRGSDNIFRNARRRFEDHVALFDYTFGAGAEGRHGVVIRVQSLSRVS